jgi:hypothetical protein
MIFPEIYMPRPPIERPTHLVPPAPEPLSASARDGMEGARALARRYLPNAVRLHAGIAFGPESEAALHTKMLCAKEIAAIAGVIPQATPAPPQLHHEDGDGGSDDDGGGEPS